MKELIPNKLIISINENGTVKNTILHYQLSIDGSLDKRKFYTMAIAGLELSNIIKSSIDYVKEREGIEEV